MGGHPVKYVRGQSTGLISVEIIGSLVLTLALVTLFEKGILSYSFVALSRVQRGE